MAATPSDVTATISGFLDRIRKPADLQPELLLFEGGIGLDSLETAELSALLEDEYGTDPFTEKLPQTVGEILAFYDSSLSGA